MENTHSILCSQINGSDTADELRKKANSIFQSKDKHLHYRSFFTTPKQFSFSHNQLGLLKVRCAQALSSMFIKISWSPGQSLFSLKQQLQHKCSNSCHTANNVPQQKYEDDCFIFRVSLCYQAWSNKKKCDLPLCNISSQDENWTLLPGCFHLLHDVCLSESTSCPLCKEFL